MSRSQGERTRLEHSLKRARAQLDCIETALRLPGPIGADVAQAIVLGALEIAMQVARHDAFELAEQDALKRE
jgi:hypothetical protein